MRTSGEKEALHHRDVEVELGVIGSGALSKVIYCGQSDKRYERYQTTCAARGLDCPPFDHSRSLSSLLYAVPLLWTDCRLDSRQDLVATMFPLYLLLVELAQSFHTFLRELLE